MDPNTIMKRALEIKTIIPAFNIPYLPMVEPVIRAIVDEDSVAMVQVARLEWEKFESRSLEAVAEEYFRYRNDAHTLLHLDHVPVIDEDNRRVDYLPILSRALKAGYQSVMVDGSRLSLADNIESARQAAELAHAHGVAVEAELGAVVGHEAGGIGMPYEELFRTKKGFTDAGEAARFVQESGCDWLSVAVGSVHGAIAESTRNQKKPEARLDVEHIRALHAATGGVPLVLHGGSGIRQEYILQAISSGVAKINVGTEIRQPYALALEQRPGDVPYAQRQVYERARWVMRDFLKTAGNRKELIKS